MTDEHVVRWVHDVLGVGAVGPRKAKTRGARNNGVGDAATEMHTL